MKTTTMKKTGLRLFGTLVVLGLMWVNMPNVRADDNPWDHAAEIGQYQGQLWDQTVQGMQEQQQFNDAMNSSLPNPAENQPAEPAAVPPQAPVVSSATPPVNVAAPVVSQQPPPPPFDPVAFRQTVLQNQERVRHQIQQVQQQVMQQRQAILQRAGR